MIEIKWLENAMAFGKHASPPLSSQERAVLGWHYFQEGGQSVRTTVGRLELAEAVGGRLAVAKQAGCARREH